MRVLFTTSDSNWEILQCWRLYSGWAHLVPDADVGPFGQQQLHLVHVLVFRGPDDGCPASIVLGQENDNHMKLLETQEAHSQCFALEELLRAQADTLSSEEHLQVRGQSSTLSLVFNDRNKSSHDSTSQGVDCPPEEASSTGGNHR